MSTSADHIFQTVISQPAHGGEMIARLDGRVIFVTGGIPGERVRLQIRNPSAKVWRGDVPEVLEPSPHRVTQLCPAHQAGAGCCDWDYIDFAYALELKQAIVTDCLQRIGKFDGDQLPQISAISLEPTAHWRTRMRLAVRDGVVGLRQERSHELITRACRQNVEPLNQLLDASAASPLQDALTNASVTDVRAPAQLFAVYDAEEQLHVALVSGKGRKRRRQAIQGDLTTTHFSDGVRFSVPVDGFWQAHRGATQFYSDRIQKLVPKLWQSALRCDSAQDQAQLPKAPKVAWDLYGGVGVFAVSLARVVGAKGEVWSVENHPQAAQLGERATKNAYPQISFVTGEVARVLRQDGAGRAAGMGDKAADVVVLDPPRIGAGAEAIKAIAKRQPPVVIHIGCDPATFARDAATWREAGYQLVTLDVVDAFPGTSHVETIGGFVQAGSDPVAG